MNNAPDFRISSSLSNPQATFIEQNLHTNSVNPDSLTISSNLMSVFSLIPQFYHDSAHCRLNSAVQMHNFTSLLDNLKM